MVYSWWNYLGFRIWTTHSFLEHGVRISDRVTYFNSYIRISRKAPNTWRIIWITAVVMSSICTSFCICMLMSMRSLSIPCLACLSTHCLGLASSVTISIGSTHCFITIRSFCTRIVSIPISISYSWCTYIAFKQSTPSHVVWVFSNIEFSTTKFLGTFKLA